MKKGTVTLSVHQHEAADVYRDRARIPEAYRFRAREGRICKISVNRKSALLEVRGLTTGSEPIIRLDEVTRNRLGVENGKKYEFSGREVHWLGQFIWAWDASDSASRIAARLGLIGVVLGIIALAVGLIPLFH